MNKTLPCPKCSTEVPAGSKFCQTCGSTVAPLQKAPKRTGGGSSKAFLAGALILVVILGGALFGLNRMVGKKPSTASAIPDHQAHVALAGPVPQWLASAPADVNNDYAWAAAHHDELQYFPCFCGCNKSAGHVSNSDCYYKRDTKGAIRSYDQHAYG